MPVQFHLRWRAFDALASMVSDSNKRLLIAVNRITSNSSTHQSHKRLGALFRW